MKANLWLRQADMPAIVLQLLKDFVDTNGISIENWTRIEMLDGVDKDYRNHIFDPSKSEILKNSTEIAEAYIVDRNAEHNSLIDEDEASAMSGVLFLASFIKQELPSQDNEYLMLMDGFYTQPLQVYSQVFDVTILLEPYIIGYILHYISISCSLHSNIPSQIRELTSEISIECVGDILNLFEKETGIPTTGVRIFLEQLGHLYS